MCYVLALMRCRCASTQALSRCFRTLALRIVACWSLACAAFLGHAAAPGDITDTNIFDGHGPWSIHVVRFPLHKPGFEIRSVHASGRAIGLGELSEQVRGMRSTVEPLAGINGDFYQRDGAHAGDPRGLPIIDGEMISDATGGASFWMDAAGEPHTDNVTSQFSVRWPNG